MNFPPRNYWEEDYAYSSRVGGEPAPTSIPMKDEWYVVRKQFFNWVPVPTLTNHGGYSVALFFPTYLPTNNPQAGC